jgi:zinc transporter ZupT
VFILSLVQVLSPQLIFAQKIGTNSSASKDGNLSSFLQLVMPYISWVVGGVIVWRLIMLIIEIGKEERELGNKFLTLGLAIMLWLILPTLMGWFGLTIV